MLSFKWFHSRRMLVRNPLSEVRCMIAHRCCTCAWLRQRSSFFVCMSWLEDVQICRTEPTYVQLRLRGELLRLRVL